MKATYSNLTPLEKFFAIGMIVVLAFNFLPWLAWNHAIATPFHLPRVGYWQMSGIVFLFGFVCRTSRGQQKK